jgi:hypothetical protein
MAEPGRLAEPSLVRLDALRGSPLRLAAVAALALAIATALWELPDTFRAVNDEVRGLEAAGALERELGGVRRVDADTRVFVSARELIPADARYAVVTGPNVQVSNAVTLPAIAPFAGYWLLPRRQVQDVGAADWVLSYGGDLGALGLEYERVVEVAPGVALAEVRT